MSTIQDAVALASMGFKVFPLHANRKEPQFNGWQQDATDDPEKIRAWKVREPLNVGIYTGAYANGLSLIVLDIDVNKGVDGLATFQSLRRTFELPPTLTAKTWSGGTHVFYWSKFAVKQGVGVWPGIDVRSRGGYVVAPSSVVEGKPYIWVNDMPLIEAPDSLTKHLMRISIEPRSKLKLVGPVNQAAARKRAVDYLESLEPALPGTRNDRGFKAACKLKDMGVERALVAPLMIEKWNCLPALEQGEVDAFVASAFAVGQNAPACDSPEAAFQPIEPASGIKPPTDFDNINKEYFFCVIGGQSRIFRETTDDDGSFSLEPYAVAAFHDRLASLVQDHGGRQTPVSKLWMKSKERRQYDRFTFNPGGARPGIYNKWRGFKYAEAAGAGYAPTAEGIEACRMFISHLDENLCQGDAKLLRWLMGYLGHLFQKPEQKPATAIVIRGKKGTGKSAFVEILSELCGGYAETVSNSAYLTNNFNSIFEGKLLFALNEAFWSGDKRAEGVLKDAITGETRLIELKGCEPYRVKCFERIVILGNDDWVVPASSDERRYAVFTIGDKRRLDSDFFGKMKRGLKAGGYAELMRLFLAVNLEDFDAHGPPPQTAGLAAQKESSMTAFEAWWQDCLREGFIKGNPMDSEEWPIRIRKSELYAAFRRSEQASGSRAWVQSDQQISKRFARLAPSAKPQKVRVADGGWKTAFQLPPLAVARAEFDEVFETDWSGDPQSPLDPAHERVCTLDDLI